VIPPSTTITERGRRIRRTLVWLAVGVVVLNLVVVLSEAIFSDGRVSGPAGSSFVTTADGAAAFAGTLERIGTEVARLRTTLDEAELGPDDTLALLAVGESEYAPTEILALDEFVRNGGRLVIAGQAAVAAALLGDPPEWRSEGAGEAAVVGDAGDIETVALSGFGSLRPTDADEPLLVAEDGTTVAITRAIGSGVVVWVADAGPFSNAVIGRADTAAALVGVVGNGRRVVFDELRHGYGEGGGLWQIIPPGWQVALVLGGITLVATLASYGRRFGPPQDQQRRLAPSRAAYLEAVGGIMARSGGVREAVSVIRDEALRILATRAGPGGDLTAEARRAGLDGAEAAAVLGDADDDETLVAVDRALATLTEERS
jgi:hypothetical protein